MFTCPEIENCCLSLDWLLGPIIFGILFLWLRLGLGTAHDTHSKTHLWISRSDMCVCVCVCVCISVYMLESLKHQDQRSTVSLPADWLSILCENGWKGQWLSVTHSHFLTPLIVPCLHPTLASKEAVCHTMHIKDTMSKSMQVKLYTQMKDIMDHLWDFHSSYEGFLHNIFFAFST